MTAGPVVASLSVGWLVMAVIGLAGMLYGLRTLRPQVRHIEEYLTAKDRPPSAWSNFLAAGSTVFGLFFMLIGLMLFVFGLGLTILSL